MRTNQDIFWAMIDEGYYDPSGGQGHRLMCLALSLARSEGSITLVEETNAANSINLFLKQWADYLDLPEIAYLRRAVPRGAHERTPANLLSIYSNWAYRPYPTKLKAD